MSRPKDVLTTGEVARLCNVAPRTVSKWFDSGKLRGYRIPGSRDRRIPVEQLVRFMNAHGIPLNGLETGKTRVLVAESDRELTDVLQTALADRAGYDVLIARTAFEAGALAESFKPHVVLMNVNVPGLTGRESVRSIRNLPAFSHLKLVAMTDALTAGDAEVLRQDGFDAALAKPFEIAHAVETIESALAVE